jgi:hypothetical protein
VTEFAWDWVAGLPEMLVTTESTNPDPTLYLVGHEMPGRWDGATWAYHLPDALGSVRQAADGAGAVTVGREWTPYGVEAGSAQAGLGYTGEWFDAEVGLTYLRTWWYAPYLNGRPFRDTLHDLRYFAMMPYTSRALRFSTGNPGS